MQVSSLPQIALNSVEGQYHQIANCFKNFTAFSTQEKFFVYKTKTTDKGARNAGGASQHIEL
jgi:hypothetical protein